ncbi:MAG: GNAT family N-acetyltransferase, partial [Terriglobia bacterium]
MTTRLRRMEARDIPAGMRLVEAAGWNQTEADWQRFLALGPEGCFVAEVNGEVHGSVATVLYKNKAVERATIAWIGMVLVTPQHRGRGLGKQLLETGLEHLGTLKPLTVKLDATPQGQPLYMRFGFTPEYEIERWVLDPARRRMSMSGGAANDTVERSGLEEIIEADARIFGGNRAALLRSLHDDAPEFTGGVCRAGKLSGYMLGRHGLHADQLGPWVADNQESARQLLSSFVAASDGRRILVDCVKAHTVARNI